MAILERHCCLSIHRRPVECDLLRTSRRNWFLWLPETDLELFRSRSRLLKIDNVFIFNQYSVNNQESIAARGKTQCKRKKINEAIRKVSLYPVGRTLYDSIILRILMTIQGYIYYIEIIPPPGPSPRMNLFPLIF